MNINEITSLQEGALTITDDIIETMLSDVNGNRHIELNNVNIADLKNYLASTFRGNTPFIYAFDAALKQALHKPHTVSTDPNAKKSNRTAEPNTTVTGKGRRSREKQPGTTKPRGPAFSNFRDSPIAKAADWSDKIRNFDKPKPIRLD
jgi:hypothetical protein